MRFGRGGPSRYRAYSGTGSRRHVKEAQDVRDRALEAEAEALVQHRDMALLVDATLRDARVQHLEPLLALAASDESPSTCMAATALPSAFPACRTVMSFGYFITITGLFRKPFGEIAFVLRRRSMPHDQVSGPGEVRRRNSRPGAACDDSDRRWSIASSTERLN
jgi:hypothetical protein